MAQVHSTDILLADKNDTKSGLFGSMQVRCQSLSFFCSWLPK